MQNFLTMDITCARIVDSANELLLEHLTSASALICDPEGCLRGLHRYAGTCRTWRNAVLERMPELQAVATTACMPAAPSEAQTSLRSAFIEHLIAGGCDRSRAIAWAAGLVLHHAHVSCSVGRYGTADFWDAAHAVASFCLPGSRTAVVVKWVHSRRYDTGELGIWYEEEGPIVAVSRVGKLGPLPSPVLLGEGDDRRRFSQRVPPSGSISHALRNEVAATVDWTSSLARPDSNGGEMLAEYAAGLTVLEEESEQLTLEMERTKTSPSGRGFPWAPKKQRLAELGVAISTRRDAVQQACRRDAQREGVTLLCGGSEDAALAVSALSVALVFELERADARELARSGSFSGACVPFAEGCMAHRTLDRAESPNSSRARREDDHECWEQALRVWVCRKLTELVPGPAGRRDVEAFEEAFRSKAEHQRQHERERKVAEYQQWDGGEDEGAWATNTLF